MIIYSQGMHDTIEYGAYPRLQAHRRMHIAAYRAHSILYNAFILLALVSGIDKFLYVLTDRSLYVAPVIPDMLGVSAGAAVASFAILEILAALITAIRARVGAYMMAGLLWIAIINFLLIPAFYHIALVYFVLSLGAIALARLALEFESVTETDLLFEQ